jgi:hypothetical protein
VQVAPPSTPASVYAWMLSGCATMSLNIFHPVRLTLYTVLSVADLGLTYALIQQGEGEVYESNPIAEAWLSSYGWTGLALFKLAIILIVATVAAFVSLSRPRTGGHILTFACLAVALVVTYSIHLSLAQELHAKFIRSPVATSAPSVPKHVYRLAWGIAPVMAGFDLSKAHSN